MRTRAELEAHLPPALAALEPGGRPWFAYPVASPGGMAGFSPGPGRDGLARAGFRPVADIVIDHGWSAMRFVPVQSLPGG